MNLLKLEYKYIQFKKMSYSPSSTKIHTDLTTYYYNDNDCNNVIRTKIQYLTCEQESNNIECCSSAIYNIYNKTYNFNECYNINNTFVEFGCNQEIVKDVLTSLTIAVCLSFCMCLCIMIYQLNKLNYFNCKKERTFSNHLIVNQNTEYGS